MGRTLWLIGMMGSGKSTVAPLVAGVLDRDWEDSDEAVQVTAGRRITDLFAESEAAFRRVEASVIEGLAGSDTVVACGGGVVTQPGLVEAMRDSGLVVWLGGAPETLAERVRSGEGRPLLTGEPAASLGRLLEEREDLYRAAADVIVATDGRSPRQVADEVVRLWNASLEE
jgi:shikimate dehydrogenase